MNVAVIIPVFNAGENFYLCLKKVVTQKARLDRVLVIDSGSWDCTLDVAMAMGVELVQLPKGSFDHGGTRQMAAEMLSDLDVLVYITQDAVLADQEAVSRLVKVFDDPQVGAVYGRQLHRCGAGAIEAHARLFNYPDQSHVRSLDDKSTYGIKAAFISNSFSAYRRTALMQVGGFPRKLILGEDMVVAARMLQAGWLVAYQADAQVYHSHAYTIRQEFKRYFDIGVLHRDQHWILEEFGKPEGEGSRFVRSEFAYLARCAPWLLPSAVVRTAAKLIGYKIGQHSQRLPLSIKQKLSMHRGYWNDQR